MKKALITTNNQLDFTQDQVKLIKDTIAVGATDQELQLFLYQAKRTGLDPLARQIYFVKRGGKVVIQTSIDGFRIIAQRSNEYAGQDEPVFTEINDQKPSKCVVTVYRFKGETRYPAGVGVAYWNEYVPQAGQDFMWNKMPHTMLSKVAEALALRKAFPQDLSGIYTDEEMEQAKPVERQEEIPTTPLPVVPVVEEYKLDLKLQKHIFALMRDAGKTQEQVHELIKKAYNQEHITKLTEDQAKAVIKKLEDIVLNQMLEEENAKKEEVIDLDEVETGIANAK